MQFDNPFGEIERPQETGAESQFSARCNVMDDLQHSPAFIGATTIRKILQNIDGNGIRGIQQTRQIAPQHVIGSGITDEGIVTVG